MTVPLNYATPTSGAGAGGRRWVVWIVVIAILGFILLFSWARSQSPGNPSISLSNFYERLLVSQVGEVTVDGDTVYGRFTFPITMNGTTVTRFQTDLPAGAGGSWGFTQWLLENRHGAVVRAASSGAFVTNFLLPFIPWLLILWGIWFFVVRQLRRKPVQLSQPIQVVIAREESQ